MTRNEDVVDPVTLDELIHAANELRYHVDKGYERFERQVNQVASRLAEELRNIDPQRREHTADVYGPGDVLMSANPPSSWTLSIRVPLESLTGLSNISVKYQCIPLLRKDLVQFYWVVGEGEHTIAGWNLDAHALYADTLVWLKTYALNEAGVERLRTLNRGRTSSR